MLEKQRDLIIRQAFQLAGIKTPETDLTDEEMSDAVYNMNCFLAGLNNDGFRLFKIKSGYMPLVPGKQEYKFTEDVFTSVEKNRILSIQPVGATSLKLSSISNIGIGQKVGITGIVSTLNNTIESFDTETSEISLSMPLLEIVNSGSDVFYGDFDEAETTIQNIGTPFSAIFYSNANGVAPQVGDRVFFQYNTNWVSAGVSAVNYSTKQIAFDREFDAGYVTSAVIIFGKNPNVAQLVNDAPVTLRKVLFLNKIEDGTSSIALFNADPHGDVFAIERITDNGYGAILESAIVPGSERGIGYLDAALPRVTKNVVTIDDFPNWKTQGYTLRDYAANSKTEVTVIEKLNADGTIADARIFWRTKGTTGWNNTPFIMGTYNYSLRAVEDKILILPLYLNQQTFLRWINNSGQINTIGPALFGGVFDVVKFRDSWYVISGQYDNDTLLRQFTSTKDLSVFEPVWTAMLMDPRNYAEFQGRAFFGFLNTLITSDFKTFMTLPVYAENRVVIEDILVNVNHSQMCTFSRDGINFKQMPFMISNESTWKSLLGMAVVSMYDLPAPYQPLCSQIFFVNQLGQEWFNKVVVQGKVHRIFFSGGNVYMVSKEEVKAIQLFESEFPIGAQYGYTFGKICGRPQSIIDAKKMGFDNRVEMPMDSMALRDYNLLPNQAQDGEPINYCFLRDAKDGTLKVWGRPRQFGEYVRFTYVEPLSLLLNANDTPDFPDEYVPMVIAGLAVEYGLQYHIPKDRLATLDSKYKQEKDSVDVHDNEDTSYFISPDNRMG